jgi:hypothetical protein
MSIDRIVFAFAGTVIFLSVAMTQFHHPYWLWVIAFVGINLLQAAFTGLCPLVKILKRFGIKSGLAFNKQNFGG